MPPELARFSAFRSTSAPFYHSQSASAKFFLCPFFFAISIYNSESLPHVHFHPSISSNTSYYRPRPSPARKNGACGLNNLYLRHLLEVFHRNQQARQPPVTKLHARDLSPTSFAILLCPSVSAFTFFKKDENLCFITHF